MKTELPMKMSSPSAPFVGRFARIEGIQCLSAKRLEARNISEEETAAALAAPAAPKRISKPTPKIVALAAAAARPKRETKLPKKLAD